jgi:outer membrane protein, heavy metal efflux system
MHRFGLTFYLLLAPGALATAAPPDAPPAPPVAELVAAALDHSPALAALRAQVAAAGARETPAAALPDPMVEAAFQDVGFPRYTVGKDENSMLGVELRQGLPYPGKRAARRAAARAETAQRQAELARLERGIAAQVCAAYARLYALDGETNALGAARELLEVLSATASSRYSAGQTEQEALLKTQLEVSRLDERVADLLAERAEAVSQLNRLLDRPGGAPLGHVDRLPQVAVPAGGWEELAVAGSAEVASMKAGVAAAERRLGLARLDLRPDLSAGAGFGYRGSFDPVVTLRFGVELPLWRREKQVPLVTAAEQELESARAELRAALALARAAAARLAARWQTAEEQLRRYREAILPQTSAAVDAARASYLAGRGDFTTVVQDFNLWLDARKQLASREADRFMTWAELDELTQLTPLARNNGAAAPVPGGTLP